MTADIELGVHARVGPVRKRAAGGSLWQLVQDQRVVFLAVGGVNATVGFACFVSYQASLGVRWGYVWSLLLAHVTSVLFAFMTHRYVVFGVRGHIWRDLWRFECVHLSSLGVNAALLPLLVQVAHMDVLISQALIVLVAAVWSWMGHSRFSFRRPETLLRDGGLIGVPERIASTGPRESS